MITEEITAHLFSLRDEKYAAFQAKLMPTVSPESIIGVRTPLLRKYAKELSKREDVSVFLDDLPHKYYDENNLHGFIVSEIKDFAESVRRLDSFLPFVDNWATCDQLRPKPFKKGDPRLKKEIERFLGSGNTYTVRFGIEMSMIFFLDDPAPDLIEKIAGIRSDEYYVNMMIAWFFATALCKCRDEALPYITDKRLDKWVHNKTVQKAVESFRISEEDKILLRSLKI